MGLSWSLNTAQRINKIQRVEPTKDTTSLSPNSTEINY